MDGSWKSFLLGFCTAMFFVAIGVAILTLNKLPDLVEQGVRAALADYEITSNYGDTDEE